MRRFVRFLAPRWRWKSSVSDLGGEEEPSVFRAGEDADSHGVSDACDVIRDFVAAGEFGQERAAGEFGDRGGVLVR